MSTRHDGADRRVLALIDEHLEDFAARAAGSLGDDTSCSITMRIGPTSRRSASSDPLSASCDDVELETGDGPCIVALETAQLQMVEQIATDRRWPAWCRTSLAAGFASSGAFPAHLRSDAVVTINVYRTGSGPWSRDALVRADTYAQEIGRVVDLCLDIRDLDGQRRALEDALAAQTAIDRAVGAIMVTNQCDAMTALTILTSGSGSRSIELADVARGVLEHLVPRDPGDDGS